MDAREYKRTHTHRPVWPHLLLYIKHSKLRRDALQRFGRDVLQEGGLSRSVLDREAAADRVLDRAIYYLLSR